MDLLLRPPAFGRALSAVRAVLRPGSRGMPRTLSIPSLGVLARVRQAGRTAGGGVEVPADAATIAWDARSARPGEPGVAVLAGRSETDLPTPGAFRNLDMLRPDDLLELEDTDGRRMTFRVRSVESHAQDDGDLPEIPAADCSRLALVTWCAWDEEEPEECLVVLADRE